MFYLRSTRKILFRFSGLLFLLFLLVSCNESSPVAIEGGYTTPFVPLKISINSWGEINVGISGLIVTPLGTFEAGLITDPAKYFDVVENTLTVRIDNQDCIYDLNGVNFSIEELDAEEIYTFIALREENKNIFLELESNSNTGCKQKPVTAKIVNSIAIISGNDIYCEGASPSALSLGDIAYISWFQVKVYREPSEYAQLVANKYLAENRTVSIVDGPICGKGAPGQVLFWKVQSEEITFSDGSRGVILGWIPEESGDDYLLKPR